MLRKNRNVKEINRLVPCLERIEMLKILTNWCHA